MIKTPLSTVLGGAFWTPGATILGSASRTLNQIIKSLFANNEQGFAYDPNDLTTMFQDAAWTSPVAGAGKSIGLMLDKSKGLRLNSNVITNGSFANDLSGWGINDGVGGNTTVNIKTDIGGGKYVHVVTSALNGGILTTMLASRICEVSLRIQVLYGSVYVGIISNRVGTYTAITNPTFTKVTHKAYIPTDATLRIYSEGASEFYIADISANPLLGNHAYQSTSSMRPLLAASPQRLDYDTADDKLITNLPAQLTGCTVIRAVPNVGTQILTGQTIPATYNDNTDHCGLIVINRALTPSETSVIANEFNKRAGV